MYRSWKCTLETYITLLTNVTAINVKIPTFDVDILTLTEMLKT